MYASAWRRPTPRPSTAAPILSLTVVSPFRCAPRVARPGDCPMVERAGAGHRGAPNGTYDGTRSAGRVARRLLGVSGRPDLRQPRDHPAGDGGVDARRLLLGHPVAGRDDLLGQIRAVLAHRVGQLRVH